MKKAMHHKIIRVAIVGRQGFFQEALVASLSLQPDLHVAGCFLAVEQVLPLFQGAGPDVLLIVIHSDTASGPEAVRRVRAAGFRGAAIFLTAAYPDRQLLRCLQADFIGIIHQSESMNSLFPRIRGVPGTHQANHGMPQRPDGAQKVTGPRLTPREIEVLLGVSNGYSNREIAIELGIAENTVKTFLRQLFRKTGAQKRAHLVRMAVDSNWSQMRGPNGAVRAPVVRSAAAGKGFTKL
jgi:DNA-binding NarL/FixJ family response regulator